jgi:hypothetical protein
LDPASVGAADAESENLPHLHRVEAQASDAGIVRAVLFLLLAAASHAQDAAVAKLIADGHWKQVRALVIIVWQNNPTIPS